MERLVRHGLRVVVIEQTETPEMLKQRNDNRAPGTKKVRYNDGRMYHPQAVNAYSLKKRCSKSLAVLPSPDVPGCLCYSEQRRWWGCGAHQHLGY